MNTAIETAGKLFPTLAEARKEAIKQETAIILISIELDQSGAIIAPEYVTLFDIHPMDEKLTRRHTIKEAKAILKQLKK